MRSSNWRDPKIQNMVPSRKQADWTYPLHAGPPSNWRTLNRWCARSFAFAGRQYGRQKRATASPEETLPNMCSQSHQLVTDDIISDDCLIVKCDL